MPIVHTPGQNRYLRRIAEAVFAALRVLTAKRTQPICVLLRGNCSTVATTCWEFAGLPGLDYRKRWHRPAVIGLPHSKAPSKLVQYIKDRSSRRLQILREMVQLLSTFCGMGSEA